MTTLEYDIITFREVTEEVEGLRVTAHCHDREDQVGVDFDCTEAFNELNQCDVEALIIQKWRGCDVADYLVEYYAETRTSAVFFAMQHNDTPGYEVEINAASAIEWLKVHRPEWWIEFLKDEDLREALTNV
jgi:hypothetical protein